MATLVRFLFLIFICTPTAGGQSSVCNISAARNNYFILKEKFQLEERCALVLAYPLFFFFTLLPVPLTFVSCPDTQGFFWGDIQGVIHFSHFLNA